MLESDIYILLENRRKEEVGIHSNLRMRKLRFKEHMTHPLKKKK